MLATASGSPAVSASAAAAIWRQASALSVVSMRKSYIRMHVVVARPRYKPGARSNPDSAPAAYGFWMPSDRCYFTSPESTVSRSASQILQRNEKAKAWPAMVGNMGTALSIAGFGTLWLNGPEPWPVIWAVFGIAIMSFATQILNSLEAEN
jgi:hypothetical protein